jgi:hypothetical protein
MDKPHQLIDNNNNNILNDYIINDSKKSHKYGEDIYAAERILDQRYKKVCFKSVFKLIYLFFLK